MLTIKERKRQRVFGGRIEMGEDSLRKGSMPSKVCSERINGHGQPKYNKSAKIS